MRDLTQRTKGRAWPKHPVARPRPFNRTWPVPPNTPADLPSTALTQVEPPHPKFSVILSLTQIIVKVVQRIITSNRRWAVPTLSKESVLQHPVNHQYTPGASRARVADLLRTQVMSTAEAPQPAQRKLIH